MVHDMRRGLDFDDTVDPDDVLPEGYDECGGPTHFIEIGYAKRLEADNARLRAALEAVEWIEDCCRIGQYCPWCRRHRASGHTPDCLRQAALGEEPSDGQ